MASGLGLTAETSVPFDATINSCTLTSFAGDSFVSAKSLWQIDRRRAFRGGSWYYFEPNCQAAFRGKLAPAIRDNDFGFRLARGAVR